MSKKTTIVIMLVFTLFFTMTACNRNEKESDIKTGNDETDGITDDKSILL